MTPGDGTDRVRQSHARTGYPDHLYTPQAKGRVERANKTLQDRLTKELRLCGISTPEQANRWLPEFMEDYNRRFAIPPRSQINALRPSSDLDLIFILSKNLMHSVSQKPFSKFESIARLMPFRRHQSPSWRMPDYQAYSQQTTCL